MDHGILHSRLSTFGVRGEWIRSYLSDRTQAQHQWLLVIISSATLRCPPRICPRPAVLHFLFVSNRKYGLQVHMYADDTYYMYLSFNLHDSCDEIAARSRIELCINDIKMWMTVNKLKLNDDKSELLIMSSKYHQSKLTTKSLQIASSNIHASSNACNLGIIFDNTLSMDNHIKNMCKPSYFQIRKISVIRKVLDDDTAATLVHALVTSRLDNGNGFCAILAR